jgi:hypothetical protein
MKRILLSFVFASSLALVASAQCSPDAYDWTGQTFGVSPNPEIGETFDNGILGLPYAEQIFVKVPINAGDINPIANGVAIDSLSLDSITVTINGVDVSLAAIGLSVACNNSGASEDPCTFLGGGEYCGDITGTPTQSGVFPSKIYVRVFGTVFGSVVPFPYQFTNYTLTVVDPNTVREEPIMALEVLPNVPNPASGFTDLSFTLSRASEVRLVVFNLVGEKSMDKWIQGRRGGNTYRLETEQLPAGVYLYSLEVQGKKYTRRMVIQH